MTKKQLFFTLFSLIFLSKTPSIQCMFRAQPPVRSSFFHNSPLTHSLWPRMFLEHNWHKNFELDTVKSITKDIVDSGSTVQKEFAWGLFSAKKDAFRECVKGHLSDNQIHALFDNRTEIIKGQLNHPQHVGIINRDVSPYMVNLIQKRLEHRGINPRFVDILSTKRTCASTDVDHGDSSFNGIVDIFNSKWDGTVYKKTSVHGKIGINLREMERYSARGQKGVIDHEISHLEQADPQLISTISYFNQDKSKEQIFNHYMEFMADHLYSLQDLQAAYAIKTATEEDIAFNKKQRYEDADCHTHPSDEKRLRGISMLITYLQAEHQYRARGVINPDVRVIPNNYFKQL